MSLKKDQSQNGGRNKMDYQTYILIQLGLLGYLMVVIWSVTADRNCGFFGLNEEFVCLPEYLNKFAF